MLLLLRLACGKRVTGAMAYKPRTGTSEISGEIDWVNQNPALNFGGLLLAGLSALWGTNTHAHADTDARSAHADVRCSGFVDQMIFGCKTHKCIMPSLRWWRQAKYTMQVLNPRYYLASFSPHMETVRLIPQPFDAVF